jgi:hypothetical protein
MTLSHLAHLAEQDLQPEQNLSMKQLHQHMSDQNRVDRKKMNLLDLRNQDLQQILEQHGNP